MTQVQDPRRALRDAFGRFHVELEDFAVAAEHVAAPRVGRPDPLHADHPRAVIGEHHAREGPWADPGHFDEGYAFEHAWHE